MMSFNTVMRCERHPCLGAHPRPFPRTAQAGTMAATRASSGAERFLGAPGGLASAEAKPIAGNTLLNSNTTMLLTWRTEVPCTIKTTVMSSKRDGLFGYITKSPLYFIFCFVFMFAALMLFGLDLNPKSI